MATPFPLVVAVSTPFANVPLAPVCGGAVNVTTTPFAGDPFVVTVTTSGANARLTAAVCGVPLVAAIWGGAAGGAVELELPQPVKKTKARKITARTHV
jgi:hypothetical protein